MAVNAPNLFAEPVGCGWCGLRKAVTTVHATPSCRECADGGRKFRVKVSIERLRRAAGE